MNKIFKTTSIYFIAALIALSGPYGALAQQSRAQGEAYASPAITDSSAASSKTAPQTASGGDELEGMTVSKGKISLDLKGVDINELFRILSMKMGVTIVPSKGVSGRVNIFLNNVTFQDALDIILLSQDLACDKKDSVISVTTSNEYERLYGKRYNEKRRFKNIKLTYAKPSTVFTALGQIKSDIGRIIVDESSGNIFIIDIPEKLELMEKTAKELDQPLETEVFDLKYAKPADMKTHLSGVITPGVGEVYIDERAAKAVVSDLPVKMKKIRRVVKAFDSASLEVFIEAEIMQITLNNQFQRGIKWDKIMSEWNNKKLGFDKLGIGGSHLVDIIGNFTPSPPLTSAFGKVILGALSTDNYEVVLSYLQTYGDTKILSRPRIAVVNNQEAKILVGKRDVYVSQTLSQAQTTTVTSESVQFIDVGVKLSVVPTINTDGFVTMKIKPEVSSVSETITTQLGSRIPIVETSEAETVVKVRDGTMIMIAGLLKDEKTDDTVGIPGISKLPILGFLFGNRNAKSKKTEIVIFLTPHIITGDNSMAGSDIEDYIPPSIAPAHTRNYMISKKIEEDIKIEPLPENRKKSKPVVDTEKDEKSEIDIQEKIKGLKGL